jgi:hypothetical protein
MRHASAEGRAAVGVTVTTPKPVAITLAAQYPSLGVTASKQTTFLHLSYPTDCAMYRSLSARYQEICHVPGKQGGSGYL